MNFQDKAIKCVECGTDFIFGVDEQRRMAAEGKIDEPQECPACRGNGVGNGMLAGTVKWFDRLKGFGFIRREDGRGEVFVHRSDIEHVGVKVLYEGERVEFEVEHDARGDKAIRVTGHDPFTY